MSGQACELTVYYDGACRVCAREMAHYRQRDMAGRICWVDISQPDVAAQHPVHKGMALQDALHARSADGEWQVGVAAFSAIWERLPGRGYRLLARMARLPGLRSVLAVGYRLFARYRHLLPRVDAETADR